MKVTVIIPVFNKQKYLERTLDLIRKQTFVDFECLMIDDGSTDGSGEICDRFAAEDHRFRVFHIPNGGVSHARNVGLEHAQGDYITFVDGDDGLHPEYLENLYRCQCESGADLVIGSHKKVWEDDRQPIEVHTPYQGLKHMDEILHEFARVQRTTGLYGYCCSKMFSRELAAQSRFDEHIKLAEDFDFYLNLYPHISTIYFDSKPYYEYRQEAENSTALIQADKIDYETQFRIRLHYRKALTDMNGYSGENKQIVEQQLCNYAYFVLFHAPAWAFQERFSRLENTCKKESVSLRGERFLQKWLLFWLKRDICFIPKNTMVLYRFIRNLVR